METSKRTITKKKILSKEKPPKKNQKKRKNKQTDPILNATKKKKNILSIDYTEYILQLLIMI